MGPNGNLSLEERSKLAPGTEVVWQTERGPERIGHVTGFRAGSLTTDIGRDVYPDDFCRLAKEPPAGGQAIPAKPSGGAPAPSTPAEPKATRKAGFRAGNTPPNKGKALVDHAKWLDAVKAVRAGMDAGRSCAEMVAGVARNNPDLRISLASFQWWQRRFIREGKLNCRPKTMPRREAAGGSPCAECASLRERVAAAEEESDRLANEIQFTAANAKASREAHDEAVKRIAELEAAKATPAPTEPFAALAACLVRIAALAPATQGRIVRAMAEIVGQN